MLPVYYTDAPKKRVTLPPTQSVADAMRMLGLGRDGPARAVRPAFRADDHGWPCRQYYPRATARFRQLG